MTRRRDSAPPGGWLGPHTTGWPDLPESDLPGQLRLDPARAARRAIDQQEERKP